MSIKFEIEAARTQLGQEVFVMGSTALLHDWGKLGPGIKLFTNAQLFPRWTMENALKIDKSQVFEYKYIIKDQRGNVTWEQGENRRVEVNTDPVFIVDKEFGKTNVEGKKIVQNRGAGQITPPSNKPQEQLLHVEEVKHDQKPITKPAQSHVIIDQSRITTDTTQQQIVSKILELNASHRTWKEKLEVVYEVTSTYGPQCLPLVAAYLHFINSHMITCAENGTHFRPNHHAELSLKLYQILDQLQNAENSFIIRSIKKGLPSFGDSFMVAVPLTRIRDIAHRGDIPQEMKSEIKNRLQNKLHRSADPGDLKTCEELIGRVRNGGYSAAFASEFEIFYEELKEFFNATGLEKRLENIKSGVSQGEIAEFLSAKAQNRVTIAQITHLRETLQTILKDNPHKSLYQQLQLADIDLEQYLFVKLSELLESPATALNMNKQLEILMDTLQNLILSGTYPEELSIVLSEVGLFSKCNQFEPINVKRLKATIERGMRLARRFTSQVIESFQSNVQALGQAFSIPQQSVSVFSEGFIRSHLIFQLSKVSEMVLAQHRKILKLPPFVAISTGPNKPVLGQVKYCAHLSDLLHIQSLLSPHSPLLILLDSADGTEEIPLSVAAILLRHDLPQLSHLAIRARQAGCVFYCCENEQTFRDMQRMTQGIKDLCKYSVTGGGVVKIERTTVQERVDHEIDGEGAREVKVEYEVEEEEMEVEGYQIMGDYTESNGLVSGDPKAVKELGSKSVNSLRLTEISKGCGLFKTPRQVTVPKNVNTYLVSIAAKKEFDDLNKELDTCAMWKIELLRPKILALLQQIYDSSDLSPLLSQISKDMQPAHLVAVRSSSTLEDLKKLAGAGLFDSVLNIPVANPQALKSAIAQVWISLYTERAIQSRKQLSIPSQAAHMSVLIQEQVFSDYCFVVHTKNPVKQDDDSVYIEIACGLGETLASANQSGNPYRLTVSRDKQVNIIAFANYSQGLYSNLDSKELKEVHIDYSQVQFSRDPQKLIEIGKRIAEAALVVEEAYGGVAQDIEGGIVVKDGKYEIYIVQTRAQV
ncbi:hypothetical protein FGO68_gene14813 [Halteria grandinella]|uniref:CBM20 domain-containing protein n=1 Tax=Halteria grandinella TaxID=5974 RepID=A0A8J8P0V8_HALGN|nr:hypothetical protein FGO68_gene14813 [Halteria grandinella]